MCFAFVKNITRWGSMNKFILWFMFFLLTVFYANAVTISSVTVSEPDTFYSNYTGNNIIHLLVTATNYTSENTVNVTVDLSNLGNLICAGAGSNVISLIKSGDTWTGTCDVTDKAAVTEFKSGKVIVTATESNGGTTDVDDTMVLSLYNIGIPSGSECYRFSDGSTNFAKEVGDFNNINLVLVVQALGGTSCVTKGFSWNDWVTIGRLTFTNVNLSNPLQAEKLKQLSDIVKVQFSPAKSYQNSKITVDTSKLPELSTTATFDLYHLNFIYPGVVLSDNSVSAQGITWISNGFDSIMNTTTFNLHFSAISGFTGFTVTDNIPPGINIASPIAGQNYNNMTVSFSATINGTLTEVSKVLFNINGNVIASYDGSVNTANCTPSTQSPEVYICNFVSTQNDGNYNLTVTAYDYGGSSGNSVEDSLHYIVQTSAPTFSVSSPVDGKEYIGNNGSMLRLKFNVTDGNGISACWYKLSGATAISKTYLTNCSSGANVQLYLSSGSYELKLYSNDTLGLQSDVTVEFSVSDDTPPKITDVTKFTGSKKVILSVNTDENATCKYDIDDSSYNNMEILFSDNITSHTDELELDRGSNYFYYVRCKDLSDNSNTASIKISIIYDNSTLNESINELNESLDESASAIPIKKFDLGFLSAGMKILNINSGGIPVTDILLTTTGGADGIQIVVTVPPNVSNPYAGNVYKYIEITHQALHDALISDVKIKFKVAKDWLDANKINSTEILLLRFDGGWMELNTSISKIDDEYIYYIADSPGLSSFAISNKAVIVERNATVQSNASGNESSLATGSSQNANKNFNWIWIILGIVVFVIVALFILVEWNDHRSPPPIFPQERTLMGRIKRLFK
jgi:PGF-pre-PGF domain-containing protein